MRNCDRAVLRVVSLSCVHSRSTAAMHKAKAKGRSSGGPAPCVWMRSNSSVQVVCKTVLEIVSPTTPTNLRVATFHFLFSATDKVEYTFGTGGSPPPPSENISAPYSSPLASASILILPFHEENSARSQRRDPGLSSSSSGISSLSSNPPRLRSSGGSLGPKKCPRVAPNSGLAVNGRAFPNCSPEWCYW